MYIHTRINRTALSDSRLLAYRKNIITARRVFQSCRCSHLQREGRFTYPFNIIGAIAMLDKRQTQHRSRAGFR